MPQQADTLLVLTYNLFSGKALADVPFYLQGNDPIDLVCLQECHPETMPHQLGRLRLAANTSTGRYGLATYYNEQRFALLQRETLPIELSLSEQWLDPDRQRFLVTKFRDLTSGKQIVAGNLHASQSFTSSATNRTRRRQYAQAITHCNQFEPGDIIVIAGDLNIPLFHRGFKKFIREQGYEPALPTSATVRSAGLGFTIDGGFAKGAKEITAEALPPTGNSDHMPVKVTVIL